jgi:hypothetical protein
MKFLAFVLVALLALVLVSAEESGPVSMNNNNIGDIVTVDVSANAVLSSNMETNIVTLLAALLNQQAAVVGDVPSQDN